MILVGRLAATSRLPRNVLVGIRIPSTMRSKEAWRAGHLAAASALTIAGVGPVVVAAACAAKGSDEQEQARLSRFARIWLLAWLGVATLQASRAARVINKA